MPTDPAAYQGREQTLLKHEVLRRYLSAWAHKLASLARTRKVKLWYVDCFAGPWRSADEKLQDTSIAIGLDQLESSARTWADMGETVPLGAVFVERDAAAFARLKAFIAARPAGVDVHLFEGEFGDHVGEIDRLIGSDPAFLFVDPTGFKGAGMRFIAPLARARWRDVLINVMYDHLNRFKDLAVLREQMREFFGLGEETLPPGLDEDQLLSFYRVQLKEHGELEFAANLAIPHPTRERTRFHLVVGTHSAAGLELFRRVEAKVVGATAAQVRLDAKRTDAEGRTGQLGFALEAVGNDPLYEEQHRAGLAAAGEDLIQLVKDAGAMPYGKLWPQILERHHVTHRDVNELTVAHVRARHLRLSPPLAPRQRAPDDAQLVEALP